MAFPNCHFWYKVKVIRYHPNHGGFCLFPLILVSQTGLIKQARPPSDPLTPNLAKWFFTPKHMSYSSSFEKIYFPLKLHIIQFLHFQTFQLFKYQFVSINLWLIDWFYSASKTSKMNQIKWFFNLIYKQNLRTNGQTDQWQEKGTAWHATIAQNARPARVIRSLKLFFEQASGHASQRKHFTKTIKIAFALCQFAPLGHWQLSCHRELSNPREKREFSIQWVRKVLLVPEEKKPLWVHVWRGRN